MSTPQEHASFLWMQGRMVELLLRYDLPRFSATFRELSADPASLEDDVLGRLRELAVVIYLREELLDQILPRIKRRLSFAAPRSVMIEALPTRGRIDWPRTLAASWRELPEEPPLEMHTRQRRRHFATPENVLTVVTLLEYQGVAQRLLEREEARDPTGAVQHPLSDIIDACSRELIFPQFAGLEREARAYLDPPDEQALSDLEQTVAEQAQPGQNSAYDDLLAWREKLRALRLLDRDRQDAPMHMLGADPRRDNYLYQLWIFYELLNLLDERACIEPDGLSLAPLTVRFRWGACRYELQHDQAVPEPVAAWKDLSDGAHRVPGVRPDYYLRRIDPCPVAVRDGDRLIWREPGIVWDAKYYREREGDDAPSSPIKRMIADLTLLGEPYGILLFAFLNGPESGRPDYTLIPDPVRSETLVPQQGVGIMQMRPALAERDSGVQAVLEELLNDAQRRLQTPPAIRCHGVFLDALTVNAHGDLAGLAAMSRRDGATLVPDATSAEVGLETLLLCPKPHIGPWRTDIVSLARDCCARPQVCHILGASVADRTRPSRLVRLEDVAAAIRTSGDHDDQRAETATRQVRSIAQRYADLIKPNLAEFTVWVQRRLDVDPLFTTFPHLTDAHRATLGLARFLWMQIEHIQAANYAGPTLLFTGVLEELARQTVYARAPLLTDGKGRTLIRSLGTLGHRRNWPMLQEALAAGAHWQAQVTPTTTLPFATWAEKLGQIAQVRNQAAHQAHVSLDDFRRLEQHIFGSLRDGFGAMNGLLLAWREPGVT